MSYIGSKLVGSWGHLGSKLRGLGIILASSWEVLGPSWLQVGVSWGHLGSKSRGLGIILAAILGILRDLGQKAEIFMVAVRGSKF